MADDNLKEFTKEELAQYDGNGVRAYVAIDGIVYDVTKEESWEYGKHYGQLAGRDLSKEIEGTPHGKSILGKLPIVGKLVD
ncbi:cytochrome b5 domain-containing protein [Lentilactobacillus sp. Marseille-Q4993]|uniref:cytochrome b5 domain-containing protein n=1 Tax=Lentilactobacillus sp. Marseille-Q4993 TaxID=3039492 RepID=UPI0024BC7CAA|nr:cytochrome b5 domain-containing protein [Lentilactobacillus sp. Marseille-Q4993]